MSGFKSMAGIAVLAFAAAAQAGPEGSLEISRETRALLGNEIVNFANAHIVNQPALAIVSSADCDKDRKLVTQTFLEQFKNRKWTAEEACSAYVTNLRNGTNASYSRTESYSRIKTENPRSILTIKPAKSMDDVLEILGVDHEKLDLPGTPQDWNTFILFHELQHSRDHINGIAYSETGEYYADRGARDYYQQAYKLGLVSDPRVADAMRGIRVINDMSATPAWHSVHTIALLAGMPDMELSTLLGGMPDVEPSATNQLVKILLSFQQARNAIYQGINPKMEAAEYAARGNPHLLYESARKLYQQGAFDHDPMQAAYAGEFLRAAETYGADYYEIKSGPVSHSVPKLSELNF